MFVHCAGNILVRDCLESGKLLLAIAGLAVNYQLFLQIGTPIPFVGRRFEDWEDEFPNLLHFVGLVIEALKPPHPHIFSVQGIQVRLGCSMLPLSCRCIGKARYGFLRLRRVRPSTGRRARHQSQLHIIGSQYGDRTNLVPPKPGLSNRA